MQIVRKEASNVVDERFKVQVADRDLECRIADRRRVKYVRKGSFSDDKRTPWVEDVEQCKRVGKEPRDQREEGTAELIHDMEVVVAASRSPREERHHVHVPKGGLNGKRDATTQ